MKTFQEFRSDAYPVEQDVDDMKDVLDESIAGQSDNSLLRKLKSLINKVNHLKNKKAASAYYSKIMLLTATLNDRSQAKRA